jgi:hypothetical protein
MLRCIKESGYPFGYPVFLMADGVRKTEKCRRIAKEIS